MYLENGDGGLHIDSENRLGIFCSRKKLKDICPPACRSTSIELSLGLSSAKVTHLSYILSHRTLQPHQPALFAGRALPALFHFIPYGPCYRHEIEYKERKLDYERNSKTNYITLQPSAQTLGALVLQEHLFRHQTNLPLHTSSPPTPFPLLFPRTP